MKKILGAICQKADQQAHCWHSECIKSRNAKAKEGHGLYGSREVKGRGSLGSLAGEAEARLIIALQHLSALRPTLSYNPYETVCTLNFVVLGYTNLGKSHGIYVRTARAKLPGVIIQLGFASIVFSVTVHAMSTCIIRMALTSKLRGLDKLYKTDK